MKKHELKTDSEVFEAVWVGAKTHEIRLNDRNYQVGDELTLRETRFTGEEMRDGGSLEYTGRELCRTVSHVLTGYGLYHGWCILSLAPTAVAVAAEQPIPMILHCPKCGLQHIDAPAFEDDPSMLAAGITYKAYDGWTNPPHRSHLCHGCNHIWRPADVSTEGVRAIETRGKADSPLEAASEQMVGAQVAKARWTATASEHELRHAFEAAARKGLHPAISGHDFRRSDDDDYQFAATRRLFEFWKTACGFVPERAAAPADLPDSRPIHTPADDEPQVDEHGRYFWRVGWNAFRNAIVKSRAAEGEATSERKPRELVTLNGVQIKELMNAVSPDDPAECEVVIISYNEPFKSVEGEDMSAGLYFYWTEYPEEGIVPLTTAPADAVKEQEREP